MYSLHECMIIINGYPYVNVVCTLRCSALMYYTSTTHTFGKGKHTMATAKQSYAHVMKLITEIGKQGSAFQTLVNEGVKACMAHAREHHDVTVFVKLVNTISETCGIVVVNEIRAYIERYAPVAFEYAADDKGKTKPINATEKKDENGELVKPYATDEQVSERPVHLEKSVTNRTQKAIEPISYAFMRNNIARILTQLQKAGDEDGRGILGPDGKGGEKTYKKGMPGYDSLYLKYEQTARRLNASFDNIMIPLGEKEVDKLSELTPAQIALIKKQGGGVENGQVAGNA